MPWTKLSAVSAPGSEPPTESGPATVEVLGVRFHNLGRDEAATAIAGLARGEGKAYVVKPYSEFMPRAARDPRLRDLLNRADLCLADGVGILWAAHYLALPGGRLRALLQLPLSLAATVLKPRAMRRPLRENMAGVDLTLEMMARLDEAGVRVFLVGGTEREARGTAEYISACFHRLGVAGVRHGYFDLDGRENEELVGAVNESEADVVLVAMGFPRQEEWIAANLPRLNVKLAVAEGGSFSFISGATPRAPLWVRRAGLEWLYRLLRQPWRLRRQLAIPRFVWLVVRERLRGV